MRKYDETVEFRSDSTLASLLQKRRAPLTEAAMQQVLQDLTWHITGSFQVLLAAFIKDEAAGKDTIGAGDIDRVDIMYASDEERYLPVFTDLNRLHTFKPQLRQREMILIADKQDLLDFLHANEKVAACVVNPGEDDLLLYRMHLQNMIRVSKER